MKGVRHRLLIRDSRVPLLVEPEGERSLDAAIASNRSELEDLLLEHGGILFRGFEIGSAEDFNRAIEATGRPRMAYLYRSTPRTELGNAIFSATEYPPQLEIPAHSENAYQKQWPLKIAFSCLLPAAAGGETPIVEVRKVTARLAPALLERFETRGIRYIRHYHPKIDLPWQTVFQTEDRGELATFCEERGIEHEWLGGQTLRTAQVAQGTARHPVTGERLFFNQAHLFHASSLGEDAAESLIELFGADKLPRHATHGDGSEISVSDLESVRAAFRFAAVSFPWEAGDVLLLDNMQVAHGRRSYKGPRRVITSLLDPYSPKEAALC